jgi:cytidylate kinase
VRGLRRYRELLARGEAADLVTITADIRARDHADATRSTAPLKPAADALLLDTTALDADQAFAAALALLAPVLEAE